MAENSNRQQSSERFRALLTPHRSLSPTGFVIVMAAVGFVSFATGLMFLIMGAWPVFGFFGLDVLLIYIAFRLNYRSGRLYETIDLTPEQLILTRVHPSGRSERFEFNPYWVQVRLRESPDGRTQLGLASRGQQLSFGRFLTDDERRDFATALKQALLAARGGVRI